MLCTMGPGSCWAGMETPDPRLASIPTVASKQWHGTGGAQHRCGLAWASTLHSTHTALPLLLPRGQIYSNRYEYCKSIICSCRYIRFLFHATTWVTGHCSIRIRLSLTEGWTNCNFMSLLAKLLISAFRLLSTSAIHCRYIRYIQNIFIKMFLI